MEEKLIHRAALKYREWMLGQSLRHTSDGRESLLYRSKVIVRRSEEIRRWVSRFFAGSTPRTQVNKWEKKARHITNEGIVNQSVYKDIALTMVPELELDLRQSLSTMASLLKINAKGSPVTLLSLKEAIEEIRVIANVWKDVVYRDGVISLFIEDIVLEDDVEEVNLGSFEISLNLKNPLDGLSIISKTRVGSRKGYYHPHVSGSHLCTGDGGHPMKEALCQGRLEDYFRIVEAILRTYNEVSPYEPLSEWYNPDHENEFCCSACEEWYNNDDAYNCCRCDTTLCIGCSSDEGGGCCRDCGDWACGECTTCCRHCSEVICDACIKNCYVCKETSCSKCLQQCIICNNACCGQCSQSCAHCGDEVCEECVVTCGCCDNNCCSECILSETCGECKEDICKGCEANCGECNKNICTYCADIVCKHCGVQMCESCLFKHNCLLEGVTSS